jgi:kynurenine 3-monooxygenase
MTTSTPRKRVLIIGAGLAGALLASMLAQRGWSVRVVERRPDPRQRGYAGGRSINLALSARGIDALARVDAPASMGSSTLAELVMAREAIPMRGRMLHGATGANPAVAPVFQPYSSDERDAINSVSRSGLNLALIEAASAHEHVEFAFDQRCIDVDFAWPAAEFRGVHDGVPSRIEADLIVATDGAFSAVRSAMQRHDRFEYSQSYLQHGYKELHIPATAQGQHAIEREALHIWPRGGEMMIALPNRDGSFCATLFWPLDGPAGLSGFASADDVLKHFRERYADSVALMPDLSEQFMRNPSASLVTIRCWPWQREGKVCLLGDAAHAIVPFYGQGMNAAFEDCVCLTRCLETCASVGEALRVYEHERKPNSDAIAEMALENFHEMRDASGRPGFLYRKRVEQTLHRELGRRAEPQYNLVSFSTVAYVEAQRRGAVLASVVSRVVGEIDEGQASTMAPDVWRQRVVELGDRLLREAEHGRGSSHVFVGDSGGGEAAGWVQSGGRVDHHARSEPAPRPVLHDLSPVVSERLGTWPGDSPMTREVLCRLDRGDSVTLSTIRATVHLGSHADGPNHYALDGCAIDRQPLEHYVGPCHVVEARVARGARVGLDELVVDGAGAQPRDASGTPAWLARIVHPRVLIRTATFPDPERWNDDFAGLSIELIDALASRGVITIGVDTPSVDLMTSKDLPAHRAIARHAIAILEGLSLRDVAPGAYELIALPLKLEGFDASPVRAVLRALA